MSERRQVALVLAGLVALIAIGIGGAALFPEECVGLEQLGELDLVFTDAVDALPLDPDAGVAAQAVGDELGIGQWRGAVLLPDDLDAVTTSEFGFFVVTEDAYTVLRPSIGVVSASRGRADLDAFAAGSGLGLRAEDGETGVFNGEYELDRCGELSAEGEVLALDRGFALVADGDEAVHTAFSSNEERWRAPVTAQAHLTGDVAVLGRGPDGLALLDARTGDELDVAPLAGSFAPWLDASDDTLLVGRGGDLFAVGFAEDGFSEPAAVPLGEGFPPVVVRAALTPNGVVALGFDPQDPTGTGVLATDRGAVVRLPDGLVGLELHASDDGHVGVVVQQGDARALLVYGPDSTA